MNKKLVLMLLGMVMTITAWAQNAITGTVVSAEDGEPIIGATVKIKGQTKGVVTDMNGKFTIDVNPGQALDISYVGTTTQTVKAKNGMKVSLIADDKVLDEVVVTALGMTRQAKTLGYASTTVKEGDLTVAKSGNLMNGLQGKVAGVQISSGGTAGQSSKVIIRGISSLNANNPLYIVDGVPINNDREGNNYADFGSGADDINPDDIADVTVLKGASATALYGSRAANGVIMITTKKPNKDAIPEITYDGSFTATDILRVPQSQNLFGEGWGSWSNEENGSWGARLNGLNHWWGSTELDPLMTKPYSFVENNIRNFYQTGTEWNNNVSFKYGNDKVGIVASYGNITSNGILPNDGDTYSRNNFSLRGYANYKKFHIDMSMNYVHKDERKVDGDAVYMELLQGATDVDYSQMKDYTDVRYNPDNYFTLYAYNPYWRVDNNYYTYGSDRVYGKLEVSFDITKDLKVLGRIGGDFNNSNSKYHAAMLNWTEGSYQANGNGTTVAEYGSYSHFRYNRSQIDASMLATYNHTWNKFSLGATAGWNYNQRSYDYVGASNSDLDIDGWYALDNTVSYSTASEYSSKRRLIGILGQVELGWDEWAYLTFSGRNDWSSTLPKGQNSFAYGGVNASVLLNKAIKPLQDVKWIDLIKVRAGVGQTGNDADVYMTSGYYQPYDMGYTTFPISGISAYTLNNRMPSTDLKPEITTEYEFGLSANFFNNRLGFDFAYYDRVTKNQIVSATMAAETGFTTSTRNIGKLRNKGIELAINGTPIKTKDWQWDLGWTFSKNNSKVEELWDGADEFVVTVGGYSQVRGVQYVLKVGDEIGEFKVPAVQTVTDPNSKYNGCVVVNNNGFPNQSSTEYNYVGGSQPDFVMGFTTKLRWKNLSLSLTGDWHKGGKMYSETSYITHFNGNSTETVFNERDAFVWPNSVKIVNGEYVENNIPVYAYNMNYVQGNYSYNPYVREQFIVDRSYFKLRELAVTYTFPKTWMAKTKFIKTASISFIAHNLFIITPKSQNYVDPESSTLGNDISSEFGELNGTVSTRNYGVNVKLSF